MISAVINCAGNGCRFGRNKMLAKINGEPLMVHTVKQFKKSKKIDEIIVTAPKKDIPQYKKILKKVGCQVKVVAGGKERAISAYNGVRKAKGQIVLIHDGARPFAPVWLIDKVAQETQENGAAMAAIMTNTCVKLVDGDWVKDSLPREKTWLGQTPHGFRKELILKAYKKAIREGFIGLADDCELVMRLGEKVKVVPGDEINIKITVPHDLFIARRIWKNLNRGKDV